MERKKPPIRAHATPRAEDFLLERLLDDGFRGICKRSNLARRKQTSATHNSLLARNGYSHFGDVRASARLWGEEVFDSPSILATLDLISYISASRGGGSGGDEDRMAAEKVAREKGQAGHARFPGRHNRLLRPRQPPRQRGSGRYCLGSTIRVDGDASMVCRSRRRAEGR